MSPTISVSAAGESASIDYSVLAAARLGGVGTVWYEDLYQTGDTLSMTLSRIGSKSVTYRNGNTPNADGTAQVSFPNGVIPVRGMYGVPGNSTAPYAVYVPWQCLGLRGAGQGILGDLNGGGTIFYFVEGTSTAPLITQPAPGQPFVTNNAQFIYLASTRRAKLDDGVTRQRYIYDNFQLYCGVQQNMYHGMGVGGSWAGPSIHQNLNLWGGSCNNGAPPGETFLDSLKGPNGPHQMFDVSADGNNTGGAVTVENAVNAVLTRVTSRRSNTAPLVLYQAFNTKTFDCVVGPGSSNSATHNGQPIVNHERTAGTVHTRLKQIGVQSNFNDNFTHMNDTYTTTIDGVPCSTVNGSLTFVDCSGIQPAQGSLIRIETGKYKDSNFNGNTNSTPPVLLQADGVTHVPYQWLHPQPGLLDAASVAVIN